MMLPRGRRRQLLLLGALAIVGAGILVGAILARGSSGTGALAGAPASQGGTANPTGSPATFTMTVPAGWHTSQQGAGTDFTSPARDRSILVTPAAAGGATVSAQLAGNWRGACGRAASPAISRSAGGPSLPGRGRGGPAVHLAARPRRPDGIAGHRVPAHHPAGRQAYLVRESAPAAAWVAAQQAFRRALSTFRARLMTLRPARTEAAHDAGGLPLRGGRR